MTSVSSYYLDNSMPKIKSDNDSVSDIAFDDDDDDDDYANGLGRADGGSNFVYQEEEKLQPVASHQPSITNSQTSSMSKQQTIDQIQRTIQAYKSQINQLYYDMKIQKSYETLEEYRNYLLQIPNDHKSIRQKYTAQLNNWQLSTFINQDYQLIRQVLTQLEKQSDTYKTTKRKKYTMMMNKQPDKTLTIRFQAQMEISVMNLLTLFYETDLYPLWFPHNKSTQLLKQFHLSKKMVKSTIGMPGLISDRQSILAGYGVDRLQINECIYVFSKSVHHLQKFSNFEIPPKTKNKVYLDCKFFCFQIHPLSRDKVFVRTLFNFHPHLKFIPQWIIDYANKFFAKTLFNKIMKYSKSFKGTKYEKHLSGDRNKEFYDWIQGKLEDFYTKKQFPKL